MAAAPCLAQDDLVAEAREALTQGDAQRAVDLFSQALIDPGTRGAAYQAILIERGKAYMALGDADAALADLDQAMRYDSCLPGATIDTAYVALEAGRHPLALDLAGRAIRLRPDLPQGYRARAAILRRIGQSEAAARDVLHAEALDAVESSVLAENAWCSLAMRKPGNALMQFDELIAAGQGDVEMLAIGHLLRSYEDVYDSWEALIALTDEAPESYASLWLALMAGPVDRDGLLEVRLQRDSLDLAAGLALVDDQIGRTGDPFARWRAIVDGRPIDGLTEEVFALADARPYNAQAAAELAATYNALATEQEAFMPARAFGASLVLESEGYTDFARELRKRTVFSRQAYSDGIIYLVAFFGYE